MATGLGRSALHCSPGTLLPFRDGRRALVFYFFTPPDDETDCERYSALPRFVAEIIVIAACVILSLWAAGFFMIRTGHAGGGFGIYAMDLLALFDSDGLWSRFLPDIPGATDRDAGSSFLGSSAIILLFTGLAVWISCPGILRPRWSRLPQLLILSGLTAFAASNRVVLGGADVFTVPLPSSLFNQANVLRASERMFWPVCYFLVFLSIALIARHWGDGNAAIIVGLAVSLQAVDTSKAWMSLGNRIEISSANRNWQPLLGEFWDTAARSYRCVRAFPPTNHPDGLERHRAMGFAE
ncbi:DUF6311 domain-containing protein [Roseomonas sp. GCM10028921]